MLWFYLQESFSRSLRTSLHCAKMFKVKSRITTFVLSNKNSVEPLCCQMCFCFSRSPCTLSRFTSVPLSPDGKHVFFGVEWVDAAVPKRREVFDKIFSKRKVLFLNFWIFSNDLNTSIWWTASRIPFRQPCHVCGILWQWLARNSLQKLRVSCYLHTRTPEHRIMQGSSSAVKRTPGKINIVSRWHGL